MNILAVNDDGIKSEGLIRLVETLSQVADIYVCAPHTQRSASSHSISYGTPIEAEEVEFENAKSAFAITGTPADCVKLGLKILEKRGISIDMVFSGINHGGNLGTDTIYSGTVGAAREGCLCNKPSVAVSVDSHNPKHFDFACELALKTCQKAFGKFDKKTVININAPDLPKEEIKGVKFAKLGPREYQETFEPHENPSGTVQYRYKGQPVIYDSRDVDVDVTAMQEGYATITPLHHDLTNYTLLEEIKKWRIEE